MTSRERLARIFAHKEADRVPVLDGPWSTTIERWRRKGMPAQVDWRDYFDLDKTAGIGVNNSPRFEEKIVALLKELGSFG
jgi:uroporphyrinogen decarboxylase